MSKEHPILFSTEMVKAILEGRKTMTRRAIKDKDQPWLKHEKSFVDLSDSFGWVVKHPVGDNPIRYEITQSFKCPYGKVGDILWVREAWCDYNDGYLPEYAHLKSTTPHILYRADAFENAKIWKPSIHMPKDACRLFLKITDIRVERLQDIREEDAIAEGIQKVGFHNWEYKDYISPGMHRIGDPKHKWGLTAIDSFKTLWKSINGEESWNSNPWVWVIEFKRTEKPTHWPTPKVRDTKEVMKHG